MYNRMEYATFRFRNNCITFLIFLASILQQFSYTVNAKYSNVIKKKTTHGAYIDYDSISVCTITQNVLKVSTF